MQGTMNNYLFFGDLEGFYLFINGNFFLDFSKFYRSANLGISTKNKGNVAM
jgi:hypothetical protein